MPQSYELWQAYVAEFGSLAQFDAVEGGQEIHYEAKPTKEKSDV